jgi:shikimate dehydrogenase
MTRKVRVGLIGHKIGYSKSGEIYTAIFDRLGLECDFQLLDVSPYELDTVVYRLRREGFIGSAVTIPHKHTMLSFLDRKDETVSILGATNSIAVAKTSLVGYNTDCAGFTYLAREIAGMTDMPRVAIVGTGGSARAVIFSLYSDLGCRSFFIFGRSQHSLEKIERDLLMRFPEAEYDLRLMTDQTERIAQLDAVVNCTPIGGWHYPDQSPLPTSLDWSATKRYLDLNYNDDNRALHEAAKSGVRTFDGSSMLVAQAIESARLWTGKTVDFAPVFAAVFPETGGGGG